jgi:hypothetical protein
MVCQELLHRLAACRFAKDGNACRVSTEGCYVLLYPLKSKALAEEAGVLGTEWDLRRIGKSKDWQMISVFRDKRYGR